MGDDQTDDDVIRELMTHDGAQPTVDHPVVNVTMHEVLRAGFEAWLRRQGLALRNIDAVLKDDDAMPSYVVVPIYDAQ